MYYKTIVIKTLDELTGKTEQLRNRPMHIETLYMIEMAMQNLIKIMNS